VREGQMHSEAAGENLSLTTLMLLELECGFFGVGFVLRTEVYSDAVAVKISADSLRYRAAVIVETSDDKRGLIHSCHVNLSATDLCRKPKLLNYSN